MASPVKTLSSTDAVVEGTATVVVGTVVVGTAVVEGIGDEVVAVVLPTTDGDTGADAVVSLVGDVLPQAVKPARIAIATSVRMLSG